MIYTVDIHSIYTQYYLIKCVPASTAVSEYKSNRSNNQITPIK